MQGKWATSEKARKIQMSNDKWADTLPVHRYVDYKEVVLPEIPQLDQILLNMDWRKKERDKIERILKKKALHQTMVRATQTPEERQRKLDYQKDHYAKNKETLQVRYREYRQEVKHDPKKLEAKRKAQREWFKKHRALNRDAINARRREARRKLTEKGVENASS